jgi:hypothetical protein
MYADSQVSCSCMHQQALSQPVIQLTVCPHAGPDQEGRHQMLRAAVCKVAGSNSTSLALVLTLDYHDECLAGVDTQCFVSYFTPIERFTSVFGFTLM